MSAVTGARTRSLAAAAGGAACWLAMLGAAPAHAHSGGVSYVDLERVGSDWQAQIDLPLPDAAVELALDADGDGALRWGEVIAANARITDRMAARLRLKDGGRDDCRAGNATAAPELVRRASGTHLRLALRYDCVGASGAVAQLDASPWFAEVSDHGVLLRVAGAAGPVTLLTAGQNRIALADSGARWWPTAKRFAWLGIEHLVTGYDHLAFLALLLIGVFRSAGTDARRVLLQTAGIVTAFTVAHSVTLALAALELVRVPVALVEAAIAASILVTAVAMALRPRWAPDWRFAFGVGLVHGLGFASLLGDLLGGQASALPLAAFNVGLELGQLALVLAVMPILLALARWPAWHRQLAPAMTWALAVGGGLWLWARI